MISKWHKFKILLSKILGQNKEKDYLIQLVQNLESCKSENKDVSFIITSQKEKGFVVKVAGLYAYVSFHFMPWKYKNIGYWNVISKYLIGEKFSCTIYKIEKNPISVVINAENQQFNKLKLIENSQIEGIILGKTKYGIFVELGCYFNWKYGSCVTLLHKSNFNNFDLLKKIDLGEKIPLIFYGYDRDNENRMIFGDEYLAKEWHTGEVDNLIGTNHNIKVVINKNGRKEFCVKSKFKALMPINNLIYPEYNIEKIKKLFTDLNDNQIINCKVVDVKHKTGKVILKWNLKIEPKSAVHFKHHLGSLMTDDMKEKLNNLTNGDL
jgi:ribosomal protein S1